MFVSQCTKASKAAITTTARTNQRNTERQPPMNLANIGNAKQISTMMIRRSMALCRRASETLRGSFGLVLRLIDEGIGILEKIVSTIEATQFVPANRGNLRYQCFRTTLHHSLSDSGETFWRH